MAAAGAPPGSYTIGRIVAEVGADQIVREPGKTNYAGSALQPIRGAFSAAQMLGCPWQRAWDALSLRPARFMGWRRAIEPGQPADFCLVKVSKDQELDHCRLYCRGVEL